MDYLVIEGYKDAADCFSKESGLKPFVDSDSILNRMIIRGAVQRGDIDDAIGRVNELDPEVSLLPRSLGCNCSAAVAAVRAISTGDGALRYHRVVRNCAASAATAFASNDDNLFHAPR